MKNIGECILLDDDLDYREMFKMALEKIDDNIAPAVAGSGTEAFKKLGEETALQADYIFIDVNMPKINGIECLADIKKREHVKDNRIIMFSASFNQAIINASKGSAQTTTGLNLQSWIY